jgi:hypothetical protein
MHEAIAVLMLHANPTSQFINGCIREYGKLQIITQSGQNEAFEGT